MADTNSESLGDESKVYAEPSKLENDYENLLRDSQILIAHYSELKKKNAELVLQLFEKDKIIENQSNKISELSKERNQLSALLKAELDSSKPSNETVAINRRYRN